MTTGRRTVHEQRAWLASVHEEALEPDLSICDPHHHLWDRPESRYLIDELLEDTRGGHKVVSTVFVECMSGYREDGPKELRPVGETELVHRLATGSTSSPVAGIVGFADLTLGETVMPVLEAHVAAGGGRFRGIRHACGFHPSPEIRNSHTDPPQGLYLDPGFRQGFACLERLGLSFDAWLYHLQLPELVSLAQAFPGVTIVLDHVGGPLGIGPYAGQRDQVFADWREGIRELATCANVVVKLGGLAMPICGFAWHKRDAPPDSLELARATAPYYNFCIEHFGAQRCMFESNFPVDKVSCSYTVLWNSFKHITRHLSAQERGALFLDTAVRVYGLQGTEETP